MHRAITMLDRPTVVAILSVVSPFCILLFLRIKTSHSKAISGKEKKAFSVLCYIVLSCDIPALQRIWTFWGATSITQPLSSNDTRAPFITFPDPRTYLLLHLCRPDTIHCTDRRPVPLKLSKPKTLNEFSAINQATLSTTKARL